MSSLRERLVQAGEVRPDSATTTSRTSRDDVERRLHYVLIEELHDQLDVDGADRAQLRRAIESRLAVLLAAETAPLSAADRAEVTADVIDNILGYGPIEPLLRDPGVSEIMVNNPDRIYVERAGRIFRTERRFVDEDHLRRIIDKIVGQVGRRVDESSPMVDARLPDGSRVNAVIAPLAVNGPMLTIRKFSETSYTAEDLIAFQTFTAEVSEFLSACVRGRLNVLVSGGTGTGKTTLLNVLSRFIPDDERIVTVEDSAELRLDQDHVLVLESRPPNIEGRGQVTIRDLVRNSLRMRPDRIVVGEVRGGEALDMLQAMNTGHDGSLSTVHANSPRDAISRLETMVLLSGYDLPISAIRQQIGSALDLIVQIARLKDGSRRVTSLVEVVRFDGEDVALNELAKFDYSAGVDEDGRQLGTLVFGSVAPHFTEKLFEQGVSFDEGLFRREGA